MMTGQEVLSEYAAVAALGGRMLDAAEAGDWDRLAELERQCAAHIDTLRGCEKNGQGKAPSRRQYERTARRGNAAMAIFSQPRRVGSPNPPTGRVHQANVGWAPRAHAEACADAAVSWSQLLQLVTAPKDHPIAQTDGRVIARPWVALTRRQLCIRIGCKHCASFRADTGCPPYEDVKKSPWLRCLVSPYARTVFYSAPYPDDFFTSSTDQLRI